MPLSDLFNGSSQIPDDDARQLILEIAKYTEVVNDELYRILNVVKSRFSLEHFMAAMLFPDNYGIDCDDEAMEYLRNAIVSNVGKMVLLCMMRDRLEGRTDPPETKT